MFAAAAALNFVNFTIIWRYFGWANQTLAAVTLWTGAVYLARHRSRWWLAALPATFMTAVTVTYILVEEVGLGLGHRTGTILGLGVALSALGCFLVARPRLALEEDTTEMEARPTNAERAGHDLAC
jgi:carbon starvation protein CstA